MSYKDTQPSLFEDKLYKEIKALPKVELHRHLLAAVRLSSFLEMAHNNNRLKVLTFPKLEKRMRLQVPISMEEFFRRRWGLLGILTKDVHNFSRIVYEAIEDAWRDNIKYIELRISPYGLYEDKVFEFLAFCEQLEEGLTNARKDFPDTMGKIILSLTRHNLYYQNDTFLRTCYEKLIGVALMFRNIIVGFDLTGIESGFPGVRFKDFFDKAHDKGFGITIHAGEIGKPDNIKEAVEILHADRIGHGIRAIENAEILQLLIDREIPLEICPTSNLLLAGISTIANHPIRKLLEAGTIITINTDDPEFFNGGITLTDEIYKVSVGLSLSTADINKIILNGLRAAFVNEKEEKEIKKYFDQ